VVWKALFSVVRRLCPLLLTTQICRLIFSSTHRKGALFLLVLQRIDLVPRCIPRASVHRAALWAYPSFISLGSFLGLPLESAYAPMCGFGN
jgi:hypothetical protein